MRRYQPDSKWATTLRHEAVWNLGLHQTMTLRDWKEKMTSDVISSAPISGASVYIRVEDSVLIGMRFLAAAMEQLHG